MLCKLERTNQNLLRLADILGEVQKRLRSVKLQAGKARNYLEYTKRLKELQVNYSLVEYHKNCEQYREKKTSLENVQGRFAVIAAELAKNDALISNLGQEIIDTENEINHTDNSLVAVQSKIEQQLQRIEFLQTRLAELQQRKDASAERIKNLQQQKKIFDAELAQYKSEQQKIEETLEEKSKAAEELKKTIQEINAEYASLEAELEDEKSGIIDIVRRTAQLHNELQSIGIYRNNLSSQKERLAGRANIAKAELEKLFTESAT